MEKWCCRVFCQAQAFCIAFPFPARRSRSVHLMSSNGERVRTNDVAVDGPMSFDGLFLSEALKKALLEMGVTKPSPIQVSTIPLAISGKST